MVRWYKSNLPAALILVIIIKVGKILPEVTVLEDYFYMNFRSVSERHQMILPAAAGIRFPVAIFANLGSP